ncbi:MAG: delta-60 repeat domain-containing protein [Deltaproteobacteria bacterium]|nr:delta-60 repeat domain-containing protein [Deltaproteobacteria bacterium]
MKPHHLLVAGLTEGSLRKAHLPLRRRACRDLAVILVICCLFLALPAAAAAGDADWDHTFNSGLVEKICVIRGKVDYTDGRFLLYGFFSTLSAGIWRNSIARLNADGTPDPSFNAPVNGEVRRVYLLDSGQILIAGKFTIGTFINFARLNADGSVDTSFPKVFNSSGAVNDIAVQADGKILLGGYSMAVPGSTANTFHLLRLNSDGTLDDSYPRRSAPGGYVSSVGILSGDAARLFGTLPRAGTAHVDYQLDLASTGVVQTHLGDETVDGPILSMGQQSNGQWLISGQFQHVLGVARSRVARFNLDMTLDPNFNIGAGANASVSQLTVQADDKIVLAGNFDAFNGTACGYLVRLNTDGSVDSTFATGTGADYRIVRLTAGGSGWLIYGYFRNYNGSSRYGIASLDANGGLTGSNVYVFSYYLGTVYALAAQNDGKILVGGDFTGVSAKYRGGIARLNPDGSLDTSFKGGLDGYVESIAIQDDGKILLAGNFGAAQDYARTSLARLNADGSLDTTFNPLVVKGDGSVSDLRQVVRLSGGQPVVAGDFAQVCGANRTIVVRLNGDGSLDAAFNAQLNATGVSNIMGYRVAMAGGNYVVYGSLLLNGTSRGFLTRFTNTGALDTTFGPTAPPTPVANVIILDSGSSPTPAADMFLQNDGKIVVGGSFSHIIDSSGSPPARWSIVRFSGSGFLDDTFFYHGSSNTINAMALQFNGKILVGSGSLFRLYPDGNLDTAPFMAGPVFAILRQASGKNIFAGNLKYYFSSLQQSIPRIGTPPLPNAGVAAGMLGPLLEDKPYPWPF